MVSASATIAASTQQEETMNKTLGAALAAFAVAGCANLPATKDVVANPQAHLANFGTTGLKPEVLAKLPKGESPLGFNKLQFDMDVSEVSTGERRDRDSLTATFNYENAGNALVKSYEEYRSNQVPYRINYKLTYRGLMQLKWQSVFHNRAVADIGYQVKTVKRADPLPASVAAGSAFEYDVASGTEVQVAGFVDGRRTCTVVGAPAAAAQLHGSLQGQYREVSCDNYGANGAVASKSTYAYLMQYGVVIPRTYADSSTRNTYKLTAVRSS
jgi:hypothetical protein